MKPPSILFLNRVYPPAAGATGQLLAELAQAMAQVGWNVTVVTSRATREAPRSEKVNAVRIERVGGVPFSRASHWRRAFSYVTLYPALLWRVMRLPRADVVVTLTDPPLLLAVAPAIKWIKGSKLLHWAQDIYPEVAEELGVIATGGWLARICRRISTWSLGQHDCVVAVGRCMRRRLRQRGLAEGLLTVIPNWASGSQLHPVPPSGNRFRREHGLEGRFVVMYSGNLGLAHPFEGILEAARRLDSAETHILFLFVGDGPRLTSVKQQTESLRLSNVRFLPPQPVEWLGQSLSAADLHLVALHENLSGLVVPSKVYGILAAGRPCIFLGPQQSEVAQLLQEHQCGEVLPPGDGQRLAHRVAEWATNRVRWQEAGERAQQVACGVAGALQSFTNILKELHSPRLGKVAPKFAPDKRKREFNFQALRAHSLPGSSPPNTFPTKQRRGIGSTRSAEGSQLGNE